jgi:two-component system, sensor histidine kinase and response regulator
MIATSVTARSHEFEEESFPPAEILVVDDVPGNLVALSAVLDELGQPLVAARSGFEALALAARRQFAVILLDVMMPELDGFATLERLRELPLSRDTPVVFVTAHTPADDTVRRAFALGAFDFVEKPIAPALLRGKVRAFVSLYRRGQELRRRGDALDAKDRNIAVLAHDLRTPLAVIGIDARNLKNHSDLEVQRIGGRLMRSVARMQLLTNDMLESARAALTGVSISPAAMDLAALCRELVEDFVNAYPRVAFAVELPEQLSGSWDRERLHQAIANLLANAVKYGSGWVRLKLVAGPDSADMSVANGGAPIAPAIMERIFEPFVRGEEHKGVGLGLHIVREVARAHGGDVRAVSDAEKTVFSLRLPLAPHA